MSRQSRWGLIGCLTCEWLALGIWVGGLLVLIGAVIPAVFNTFGGQDSGGFFLTKAFEGYNRFVMGALAVLCAGTWYRWWSGLQAVAVSRVEMALLLGMTVIAGIIILWLHPQAASLQAEAFAVKEEAARKAAFAAFFRIHMPVRSLYMVNLVLGIILIGIKAKRSLQRDGVVT
ncbi:MAG: DUF4149 domain-containing protein [Nitrospirae bacterium]|nr:DUF4149 domain-containing protein [Nitrospirota bacterium]